MTDQVAPSAVPLILSPHERRRIAVAASCAEDTILNYLRGRSLRSTTIDRIEKALRNANLERVIASRTALLAAG